MLSVHFYCPDCKFEWEIQYARFVNKKVCDLQKTLDVISQWYSLPEKYLDVIKTFSQDVIKTKCTVCQCRVGEIKGVSKNITEEYAKIERKQKTG